MAPELDLGQLSKEQRVIFNQLLETGRKVDELIREGPNLFEEKSIRFYLIGESEDALVIVEETKPRGGEKRDILVSEWQVIFNCQEKAYFGKHIAEVLKTQGIRVNQ